MHNPLVIIKLFESVLQIRCKYCKYIVSVCLFFACVTFAMGAGCDCPHEADGERDQAKLQRVT
jgi:hypothetical protein